MINALVFQHLETGFPAVVFGWKVDKLNLPFCSLMAKWVADGSSGPPGQLSFAVVSIFKKQLLRLHRCISCFCKRTAYLKFLKSLWFI